MVKVVRKERQITVCFGDVNWCNGDAGDIMTVFFFSFLKM